MLTLPGVKLCALYSIHSYTGHTISQLVMLNNIIQDGVILACLTFAEDQARSSGVVTKYYCKYYHNLEDLLRAGTVEKKNSFNIKQRNNYTHCSRNLFA